jgi:hypothetical protein
LGRKKPNEMKCKLHVAIQQNREKKETFVKLDQTKKQKRKRQALLEKANGIKQTNPLPNPSINHSTATATPNSHPPSTSNAQRRKACKKKEQTPNPSRKRIPETNRRTPIIRPLRVRVQARPF